MFSDQYPFAVKGIEQQLIPWVETSQLAEDDKRSIIAQLNALLPKLEERTITKKQLLRLHNCLQDNPILIWGAVESILAQAEQAGLTATEQETLVRVSQRLMRAATERKLGRNDLEFCIQDCAVVRKDGQSLEVLSPITAEQIREFMKRAEQLAGQYEIPNEPFDKTSSEAFAILVAAALDVDE